MPCDKKMDRAVNKALKMGKATGSLNVAPNKGLYRAPTKSLRAK